MRKLLTLDNLLVSFWFVLILLVIFGHARNLEYLFAPFLVIISLCINIRTQTRIRSRIINCIIAFIFITLVSSFNWFYIEHQFIRYNYIQYLCYSICAYFVTISAYNIMRIKILRKDTVYIKILIVLLYIVGIERFFHAYMLIVSVKEFAQVNGFYYILMPLPLIFLIKNNKLTLICIIISVALCLMSAKRSALISIVLLLFLYICVKYKENRKYAFVILGILIIALLYLIDNYLLERISRLSERMSNISEDGGSGRTIIIQRFFDKDIYDIQEYPTSLLGNGFESYSFKYNGAFKASHNDFLEVLYSFGMIGLINLIVFYILLIKRALWSVFLDTKDYVLPCFSVLILFAVYGMVGNNFYFFHLSLPLFMYIGFSEAIYGNYKKY